MSDHVVELTRTQRALKRLQQMPERDLNRTVIIPLFEAMGYERVEYHDGPSELGVDVVCIKKHELGHPEITAIQIKKFMLSKRTHETRSFQQVVTQLSLASETELPTLDHGLCRPANVYFITPFPLDTATLKMRFEKFESLRHSGLYIVDGTLLLELLSRYLPVLAQSLAGVDVVIAGTIRPELTNRVLMDALHVSRVREVSTFYTDIDFSPGKPSASLLLHGSFDARKQTTGLNRRDWEFLKQVCARIQSSRRAPVISPPATEIDDHLKPVATRHDEWNRVSGQRRKCVSDMEAALAAAEHEYQKKSREIAAARPSADEILKQKQRAQRAQRNRARAFRELRNLRDGTTQYEQVAARLERHQQTAELEQARLKRLETGRPSYPRELGRVVNEFVSAARRQITPENAKIEALRRYRDEADLHGNDPEFQKVLSTLIEAGESLIDARLRQKAHMREEPPKPVYEVSIDGFALAKLLEDRRDSIRREVKKINSGKTSGRRLAKALARCQEILDLADDVFGQEVLLDALNVSLPHPEEIQRDYRLTIPVDRVLDTGMSLCLLGEAGAGKTTSLQMYARQRIGDDTQDLVVFVSMSTMATVWRQAKPDAFPETRSEARSKRKVESETSTKGTPSLVSGIAYYLASLAGDSRITESTIESEFARRRSVILLDGIDEAIRMAPWILECIRLFSARFPEAQVITSSRVSGDYLGNIPHPSVMLMPFTLEQRSEFFDRWFEDGERTHVIDIETHLEKNERLSEIVTNPLLATVLCVLKERGVPLPDTEVRLYEERMSLLLGHYEIAKGIRGRIISDRANLAKLARKLAFHFQVEQTREFQRRALYKYAEEIFRERLPAAAAHRLVDELIDPCNVLVPMTLSDGFGFGHRRFQEHLAAEEIRFERPVDRSYFSSDWWRGTLALYSQMADSIEWVVEGFAMTRLDSGARKTLEAMIEMRPLAERERISEVLSTFEYEEVYVREDEGYFDEDLDWEDRAIKRLLAREF